MSHRIGAHPAQTSDDDYIKEFSIILGSMTMAIFDLYSKRKADREKKGTDVFNYTAIPEVVRVQVVQIIEESLLLPDDTLSRHYKVSADAYEYIVKTLRREKGRFSLIDQKRGSVDHGMTWPNELFNYLLLAPTDDFLDALELSCRCLGAGADIYVDAGVYSARETFPRAIKEVNHRLLTSSLGYQYSDGDIIKVDSQIIHSEAVIPALEILRLPGYKGAQAEFLKAHEHYRHGRNAEALNECYKAFESLMKSICDKHKWNYDKGWAAAKLIEVCIKNGLIPAYYHSHLIGLKSILESAIPTPRNKAGAHGSGTIPTEVPNELASYVVHLTASTLLYLATMEAKIK